MAPGDAINGHGRNPVGLFECHLEEDEFIECWLKLLGEIDEQADRLVAYKIDARSAKETQAAGTMVCSEKVVCYLV